MGIFLCPQPYAVENNNHALTYRFVKRIDLATRWNSNIRVSKNKLPNLFIKSESINWCNICESLSVRSLNTHTKSKDYKDETTHPHNQA
jgi:hypothetical protein